MVLDAIIMTELAQHRRLKCDNIVCDSVCGKNLASIINLWFSMQS